MADEIKQPREIYSLDGLQVACGTMGMPTATVRLRGPDGGNFTEAAVGQGPVDAAFKAIDSIVKRDNKLLEFNVQSVTEGIDALGTVSVRVIGDEAKAAPNAQHRGGVRSYGGHGADMDIVVASVKAYLSALNKMIVASKPPDTPVALN